MKLFILFTILRCNNMKKSAIMKVSNASFFRKMKGSLLSSRKVFTVEARLIIKQTNENTYEKPKTNNYRICLNLAKEAFEREDFKEALPNIQQCLTLLKKTSDSINRFDKARIYEFAAKVYKKNYLIHNSILLFKRRFEVLNTLLGENNIFTPSILYELADSYSLNKMMKEAVFYYKKFLNLEIVKNSNIMKLKIYVISEIAIGYYYIRSPEQSIKVLKQFLSLKREYFNKYAKYKLKCHNIIGDIYLIMYKNNEARKHFTKCFDIMKKMGCGKQISKKKVYKLLIKYYETIKMPDHSLVYAKKAIKYIKTLKKDSCLSIAYIYRDLSYIYGDKNEREKEFYYYSKFLIILKKIIGTEHSEFLISLFKYIDLLNNRSLRRTALNILKNIPKEFNSVLRSNDLMRGLYRLTKGSIYVDLGISKKASKQLKEAKKLILDSFGKHHPLYIASYTQIGKNFMNKGDYNEALTVLHEVYIEAQRFYSYFSTNSAQILYMIAQVYSMKGEIRDSMQCFRKYFHILEKLNLGNTYKAKEAYLLYANLYRRQGKLKSFFHFLRKSLDLKITDDIEKVPYFCRLYKTIADYYFNFKKYKIAKRVYTKELKAYLSSDEYSSSFVISKICRIATCEIGLENHSEAHRLYTLCKNANEELVKDGELDQININTPEILMIRALLYHAISKNYQKCLNTLNTVLFLKLNLYGKYDRGMTHVYHIIAQIYRQYKRYDKSVKFYELLLKIELKSNQNLFTISEIYKNIGETYIIQKNADESTKYLKICLRVSKRLFNRNNEKMKNIYNLIGLSYFYYNKPKLSIRYLNKGLVDSEISSLADTCILNSIGVVYSLNSKKLIVKALKFFKISEGIARKNKFDSNYVQIFCNNVVAAKRKIERISHSQEEENYAIRSPEKPSIMFKFATLS